LSFKEYLGYEDSLLPRLATGFGGGIGRKGSLCGALTGSVMVIGMKGGRVNPNDQDSKERVYKATYQFWDWFEKKFGNSQCHLLIGCHLDNEKERKKWLAAGGMKRCAEIVETTAQLLFDFIKEMK